MNFLERNCNQNVVDRLMEDTMTGSRGMKQVDFPHYQVEQAALVYPVPKVLHRSLDSQT